MSYDNINGYYIITLTDNLFYCHKYIVCKGYDELIKKLNFYENEFHNINCQINRQIYLMNSSFTTDSNELELHEFIHQPKKIMTMKYTLKIDNIELC